jgi:hypothetical protein
MYVLLAGKKRKSAGLPSKKPGNQWTSSDVEQLNIVVLASSPGQVLAVDPESTKPMPSLSG